MKVNKTKKRRLDLPRSFEEKEHARIQEFLDMCTPAAIKFYPDHYICGSSYRSVWAIREYPTQTNEQAILRHLGEKSGVTLEKLKELQSDVMAELTRSKMSIDRLLLRQCEGFICI